MDEQMREKFEQWAQTNINTFLFSDKEAVAWDAWQAATAALPAAAEVVAIRYKNPGDLQWQYTENKNQPAQFSIVQGLQVTPKATALSQPAAQGDPSHPAGGECGGVPQPAAAEPVATFKCWEEPRFGQQPRQLYALNLTRFGHDLPAGEYEFFAITKATQ